MNIFALDNNPIMAARALCDKHIVKMPVESAQMLSTAHRVLDGSLYTELSKNNRKIKRWKLSDEREGLLYKASFINHPCTQWTIFCHENYIWHSIHAKELCLEYSRRYGKTHGSQEVIDYCSFRIPENIRIGSQTHFARAMPDTYKNENGAVQSYRNYYLFEKANFAKWKNGNVPYWWSKKNIKTEENVVVTA